MAVHTYVVAPLTSQPNASGDILWTCTGTADGVPFSVQFFNSAVSSMTISQLKTFVKSLIDAQVFPVFPAPSGVLVTFQGGTFTQ
jgi:hypothetical protein